MGQGGSDQDAGLQRRIWQTIDENAQGRKRTASCRKSGHADRDGAGQIGGGAANGRSAAAARPRTTTAANGSIVYDLSALNMADYRAFLVFATVDAAGSGVSDKGRVELLCDSKSIGLLADAMGGHAATVAWIFPAMYGVAAGYHTPTQNRNDSFHGFSGAIQNLDADWNTMQSMTFKFTGLKGASCVLYGLKA